MKRLLIILIWFAVHGVNAQKMGVDLYARIPHAVDYRFSNSKVTYDQLISAGVSLHYLKAFADIGSFVSSSELRGYYSYFGATVMNRQYPGHSFLGNVFGEVTYLPAQGDAVEALVKTIGISPVVIMPLKYGGFGVALTAGVALINDSAWLNSRIIFNYSLPVLKSKR